MRFLTRHWYHESDAQKRGVLWGAYSMHLDSLVADLPDSIQRLVQLAHGVIFDDAVPLCCTYFKEEGVVEWVIYQDFTDGDFVFTVRYEGCKIEQDYVDVAGWLADEDASIAAEEIDEHPKGGWIHRWLIEPDGEISFHFQDASFGVTPVTEQPDPETPVFQVK